MGCKSLFIWVVLVALSIGILNPGTSTAALRPEALVQVNSNNNSGRFTSDIVPPTYASTVFASLNGISGASTSQVLEFSYRQRITIGSDVVSGGPHSNFPFLFSSTSTDLAHTSHGGKVTSESGYDIIFRGLDDDICGGSGTSPCT
jgi:hypothetical protein